MQPPSSASRSSTRTLQPPRASRAAQASELIPLPTTTASATRELAELVVGHEAAFAGPELLHAREHVCVTVLGQVEPELLGLDPDRVEPTLLAEHDPALGADELGGVRLDRRWVVELARHCAALTPEERLARDRLPRLERVARQLPHPLRDLAHSLEAQVRVDAVERMERESDLAEVRVARALPHAVDRAVHPASAGTHRRHRGRGGEAEVVVPV